MKIFFLTLVALALTACSKPHDKYVGYWQLEDTKYPKVLEIYKEGKETYIVNENILSETDWFGNKKSGTVLEKKEKELGVNNSLAVITFNLSDDGKTLRISNQRYTKISEDDAKQMITHKKNCESLRLKYREEAKAFNIFARDAQKVEQDKIKDDYRELQKEIPNCSFGI
ncbi:hypothetical protein ACBP83_15020 [Acinetobacter pseudolwoffii]|uniref:hypothetical protein n=1 Tax=Acinetobacter pseudolwoffii TaxID=2053287 RepID=UPI0035239729